MVRSKRRAKHETSGLDLVWRDFRDLYGVLWSLRVAGLMNSYAQRYHWPVALGWRGFVRLNSDVSAVAKEVVGDVTEAEGSLASESTEPDALNTPPEIEADMTKSFRTTLRRFVSPKWLDERLEERG